MRSAGGGASHLRPHHVGLRVERLRPLYAPAFGGTLGAVFERFTETARQVVVVAQEEARALKHDYLGTEHLLLGLLRADTAPAARVLGSLGVTVEEVRAQVARIVGHGEQAPSGQVPFTPRAKKVLELSLQEARALGHDNIGTEHILLGLVREGEGIAARVLAAFADPDQVVEAALRELGHPRPRSAGSQPRPVAIPRRRSLPRRVADYAPAAATTKPLVIGWILFGSAFGLGILAGWLIWG